MTGERSARPPTAGPLVIGIGNEVRGDDGAGIEAVRELKSLVEAPIRIVESHGGMAELLDLWEGQDEVFLLDAVQSGAPPGTWRRQEVGDQPLPASWGVTSTHGLSVASAVALGQALDRMPRRLVVYGIEAARFDPGLGLSPPVVEGVRQAARALAAELRPAGDRPPAPRGA